MLVWGCGDKGGGPSDDGKVETFDVVFITDPAGATVYFDGDSVGVTTEDENNPLIVMGLVFGKPHEYRIVKAGYAPVIEPNYSPAAPGVQRVEKTLNQSATVTITTTPPGAFVTFGSTPPVERVSPLTIEGVKIGKYQVTVRMQGYMTLYDSLDVSLAVERNFTLFVPPNVVGATLRAVHKNTKDYYQNELNRFDQRYFNTAEETEDYGNYRYMQVLLTIDRELPDLAPITIVLRNDGEQVNETRIYIPARATELIYQFRNPNNPKPLEPIIYMMKGNYQIRVLVEGRDPYAIEFVVF
jgi:hypothetical protein